MHNFVIDYRRSLNTREYRSSQKSICSKEEIILVIVASILLFSVGILLSLYNEETELSTILYDGVNSVLFVGIYWSQTYSIAYYITLASTIMFCLILCFTIIVKVNNRNRLPDWFLNLM